MWKCEKHLKELTRMIPQNQGPQKSHRKCEEVVWIKNHVFHHCSLDGVDLFCGNRLCRLAIGNWLVTPVILSPRVADTRSSTQGSRLGESLRCGHKGIRRGQQGEKDRELHVRQGWCVLRVPITVATKNMRIFISASSRHFNRKKTCSLSSRKFQLRKPWWMEQMDGTDCSLMTSGLPGGCFFTHCSGRCVLHSLENSSATISTTVIIYQKRQMSIPWVPKKSGCYHL